MSRCAALYLFRFRKVNAALRGGGRPAPASHREDALDHAVSYSINAVLQAIRESDGVAVAVTEDEIVWGMRALWEEGIFSEPTGAVTIPALRRLQGAALRSGD